MKADAKKQAVSNKWFMVAGLLFLAVMVGGFGIVLDSWLVMACGGLFAAGAVVLACNQVWGIYLPVLSLVILLAALMWWRYQFSGYFTMPAGMLLWGAVIYIWNRKRRRQLKKRVTTARRKGSAASDALARMANDEGRP
jgi:hypothetical protein